MAATAGWTDIVELDDPQTPEFASWQSYTDFARRVRQSRRYVWGKEEDAFLATVLATKDGRDVDIPEGATLFRAQRGIDWHIRRDENDDALDEEPVGYDPARMTPRAHQATEGRANPAGIPVLYLGTTETTAISEVRPWIGAAVSVAQFRIRRPLKAIDLSQGHGKSSFSEVGFRHLLEKTTLDAATKHRAVWIDIDNAFSRPVTTSDDSADYVPTQVLAELFRSAGYDAVVYRSQFGKDGFNVALFDIADAEAMTCGPYEVTAIEVSFRQTGNAWFKSTSS